MPFWKLNDEQILGLLDEQPNMMKVPGVALVWVEFIDPKRTQIGVVVTVYAGNQQEISQLPVSVAGLPVIVKVENRVTGLVEEIIDPRKGGGKWPGANHRDQAGL